MNIFKPTTFTWWQLGILKWASLLFGLAIGTWYSDVLMGYAPYMLGASLIGGLYLGVVWMRGK